MDCFAPLAMTGLISESNITCLHDHNASVIIEL
jgi:hypothetical protein